MLELDLLLRDFLDERYDGLNEAEQAAFRALLVYPDAELIEWLMGRSTPMDGEIAHVVQRIRAHAAR
jgi:antitoxin CptB